MLPLQVFTPAGCSIGDMDDAVELKALEAQCHAYKVLGHMISLREVHAGQLGLAPDTSSSGLFRATAYYSYVIQVQRRGMGRVCGDTSSRRDPFYRR